MLSRGRKEVGRGEQDKRADIRGSWTSIIIHTINDATKIPEQHVRTSRVHGREHCSAFCSDWLMVMAGDLADSTGQRRR